MDTLTPAERSQRMSLIRSRDTKPELLVRKTVWAAGFRFRLNERTLPGKPDLVFPGLKTVVFIHGCYWHAHTCQKGRIPKQNSAFWADKFASNKARDALNAGRLRRAGWSVLTVWECAVMAPRVRDGALRRLIQALDRRRRGLR